MNLGGADKAGLDALRIFGAEGYDRLVISTNTCDHGNRWKHLFEEHSERVIDMDPKIRGRVRRGTDLLTDHLKAFDPDLVLINNSVMAYDKIALLREFAPRARISCLYHMILKVWPFEKQLARWKDGWDVCLATNDVLRNRLINAGVPEDKIRLVYSAGYAPGEMMSPMERDATRKSMREKLRIGEKDRAVIFPFRFHAQKRPEMIAEIASRLPEKQYVFICAGDGPKLEWVKRLCLAKAPNHRFRWLGHVEYPKMQALYAAADLHVLPSRDEGLPLAFFESMESGTPIVASKVGGNEELVTEECGRLIELGAGNGDEGARYAQEIQGIFTNESTFQGMVDAGKTRISELFSWDIHHRATVAAMTGDTGTHEEIPAEHLFSD